MRIFLSNDDGIDALGPDCRERVARRPNDDIWIVAPEKDQSGASHSPSLSEPVRCRSLGKRKFAVQGTPTDSVLMGILDLVSAPRPNLVLSGINRGGGQPGRSHNIFWHCGCCYGGDTARGIPSIAFSRYTVRRDRAKWTTAERYAPDLINRLVFIGWASDV